MPQGPDQLKRMSISAIHVILFGLESLTFHINTPSVLFNSISTSFLWTSLGQLQDPTIIGSAIILSRLICFTSLLGMAWPFAFEAVELLTFNTAPFVRTSSRVKLPPSARLLASRYSAAAPTEIWVLREGPIHYKFIVCAKYLRGRESLDVLSIELLFAIRCWTFDILPTTARDLRNQHCC